MPQKEGGALPRLERLFESGFRNRVRDDLDGRDHAPRLYRRILGERGNGDGGIDRVHRVDCSLIHHEHARLACMKIDAAGGGRSGLDAGNAHGGNKRLGRHVFIDIAILEARDDDILHACTLKVGDILRRQSSRLAQLSFAGGDGVGEDSSLRL